MPVKFLDVLPDPNYPIDAAGFQAGSVTGPGFVSMQLTEMGKSMIDRTHTGRVIRRTNAQHKWLVNIKYNPLTKVQFDPVYTFLMEKRGGLKPFYVSMPQYKLPKDTDFATYVQGAAVITTTSVETTGTTVMEISSTTAWSGLPKFGDLFTINDSTNSLHTKTYMISRVENDADYNTTVGQPTAGDLRIHFTPGLQKTTASDAVLVFNNPLIQVVQLQDIQEYSLDTENLYAFALKLEEALY